MFLRIVALPVVFCLAQFNVVGVAQDAVARKKPVSLSTKALKKRINAVYEKVSPTIVSITFSAGGKISGTVGVIVSKEGHIVAARVGEMVGLAPQADVRLADGRHVKARTLGWSNELRIGLLKISKPGAWPHAKLGESGQRGENHREREVAICAAGQFTEIEGRHHMPYPRISRTTTA